VDTSSQAEGSFAQVSLELESLRALQRVSSRRKVLVWYVIGLTMGSFLGICLLWGEPASKLADPVLGEIGFMQFFGLVGAFPFCIAGSAGALAVVGLLTSNRWCGRGVLYCVMLGTAAPMVATVAGEVAYYRFGIGGPLPPGWAASPYFWLLVYAIPATVAAFSLLRPGADASEACGVIRWGERALCAGLVGVCAICFPVNAKLNQLIDKQSEANYQQGLIRSQHTLADYEPTLAKVAGWVKATYPSPSDVSDIRLPAEFPRLADSDRTLALLRRGGQVMVLITLFHPTSLSDGGPAIVYVTIPLMPGQIGKDSAGEPIIKIRGMWQHHVEEQLSPHLYRIELDHDPD